MTTKAMARHIGIVNQMRPADKDRLILNIIEILDGPEPWSCDEIEYISEELTKRGFVIRDPNDEELFEPCELED